VRLTRSGPIGYYRVGSAEGWASGAGIAQIAHSALDKARRAGKHTRLFEVAKSVPSRLAMWACGTGRRRGGSAHHSN